MTKIYSLNSDVKFPDMEHYDMGKASDMALYLAHCDFYPFRSVIENNKKLLMQLMRATEIWRKKQD
ncbi:hypothetical protein [Pseudoruminococcus massiliensis]|uniref:hypothetical protein n=1 Tax=Pseudoruminococcus massiliensis TaxID=2086583 RepID=UPI0022E2A07C|nr:hypothetical protein [Pseudoruminococcus massiliensis]